MEAGLQNKIESIQVLRFFAAFSVMLVHTPIFEFGHWGVDIFFVISGFIMMYITEKNNNFFLIKRFIRIIPLYWILTLGVFAIVILKPEYLNNTTANIGDLIKSLLFIPFNKNGAGHYPVLFLGWTLNFEIIFYLLFSLSLFISKKYKFILCSFALIIFYFSCSALSKENFIFYAYANDMLFEFIYGMLAFIIWDKYASAIKTNFLINLSLLILFFIITIFFFNSNFPVFISRGIPAFLMIIYVLFLLNNFKFPKILITLGDASFCIYLLHPYVIQFFYKVFEIGNYNTLIQFINTVLITLIIFIISIYIFKFIERPINISLKKKFNL
ncbi:acyltransferase [Pelagibacteraceae bacterium]|nr:acyltransferase [Pelagibacteraceae bacterium]